MNLSKENMRRISGLVESGSTISLDDIKDLHGHNEHLTLLLEARGRLMLGVEVERDRLQAENNEFRRRAGSMNLDGFGDAFYKVAERLGITGPRPESPMQVFASEIYPALCAAVDDAERLKKATEFVKRLCDSAGKQPSVATGYLHDILSVMSKEG